MASVDDIPEHFRQSLVNNVPIKTGKGFVYASGLVLKELGLLSKDLTTGMDPNVVASVLEKMHNIVLGKDRAAPVTTADELRIVLWWKVDVLRQNTSNFISAGEASAGLVSAALCDEMPEWQVSQIHSAIEAKNEKEVTDLVKMSSRVALEQMVIGRVFE